MKFPWAWVSWLAVVLVMLSITRNPLYIMIILLCVFFVRQTLQSRGTMSRQLFSPVRLALWIILIATIFNALISHFGETILFIIPGKIPLISGKVTLEAIVYGATNGLILAGMLASFSVLSLALPIRDLISLIPRAFFPLAIVTSIAVTYLPTTFRQFHQIREAQAVRGHQMRTLRDWLPLIMPLLVGGLEHAMQLAEAMTARGFASSRNLKDSNYRLSRALMLVGLVFLAGGWLIRITSTGWSGLALILGGAGLILSGLWFLGHQSPRTLYHRPVWSWRDGLVFVMVLGVLGMFTLPIPDINREVLFYDPYPVLQLPEFNPLLGFVMLGLLIPGIIELIIAHPKQL